MKSNPSDFEIGDTLPEGLTIVRGYLDEQQQREMLEGVEQYVAWTKRQYGDCSPYSGGWIEQKNAYDILQFTNVSMFRRGAFPWVDTQQDRLSELGLQQELTSRIDINRYQIYEGIGPHVDSDISTHVNVVSLQEKALLQMHIDDTDHHASVVLDPGDLYCIEGPARFQWKHAIAYGESFTHRGIEHTLSPDIRRISVSLRSYTNDSLLSNTQSEFRQVEE